jgi:DNA-binding NarL/FixJ family response regulator
MALRLIIVDDNTHFLDAAQGLLDCEGMSVVGVATTSADALGLAAELCPDVVLVDIDLGQESGFDLARSLMESELHRGQRVILTSAYPEEDFAELIETSSAIAFLPKSELSARAIVEVVDRVGDEHDPGAT